MKVSQKGIDLIKKYEGLRLKAYRDVAGVLTIGYGSTKGVKPGMMITAERAEELLAQDIADHARFVDLFVTVPLNQNQYDALASFTFNLGGGALKTSTLLKKLNKGAYSGAAEEFLKWTKADGKVQRGLVRRREEERKLFLTPVNPAM